MSHPTVVSENPADTTPHIVLGTGDKMKAFEQIGRTMYAGGRFEQVRDPGMTTTYSRDNFFAFDADTGAILPLNISFDGSVTGIEASDDETALFISGTFNAVNGDDDYEGLIKYDLVNDRIDTTFDPDRMRNVYEIKLVNGALIASGNFSKHLVALDPTTGEDLGTIDIEVEGEVNDKHSTRITHFGVSPDGTRLVATGNFEEVNGQDRQRAFMLNLGATATLSTWYAPRFEYECDRKSRADSAQGVDFSPDGSYFVIAAHGGSGIDGICDAAARFETANVSSTVEPTWINFSGGDTLWSVAITDAAVYVGGHQRWLDNPHGDDEAGPGAVERPGIGAIDPVTGKALPWNPTKSRDDGTRVLFATPEGLWVGSDGPLFADEEHHGIAFVPLDLSPTPDNTPPQTFIESGPVGAVSENSATFSFSANETSTFQCSLDGGLYEQCASPVDYDNLGIGSHTLLVRAIDESLNADQTPAEHTWIVFEPGTTIYLDWNGSIEASSDDAEEDSSGDIDLSSSDLEIVWDKSEQQVIGLRFTGVNIPSTAAIQNAYIQFQADEQTSDPTSLTIVGEATDDASTFTGSDDNISDRPPTLASVGWSPQPWTTVGQAGVDEQTPNLAQIVQEIVDRPGWSSGNALAFFITGSGSRVAESYDGDRSGAPKLFVNYSLGNQAPTTTGIADVLVNTGAPDTVINLFDAFDDSEDADSALSYSIESNTNASLFNSYSIDPVQGALTLNYAAAAVGEAEISIRAADTGNPPRFIETTFTVSVVPVNQAPTSTGIANVSVSEGSGHTTIDLRAAFDDPDGSNLDLTFSIEANTNSSLFASTNIDDGQGTLTLDFAPDANGSADITIRVTDSAGLPERLLETTFTVDVAEVNHAPVRTAGEFENLTVVQNSPATSLGLTELSFGPGPGADEVNQTLSYSVTSVPPSSMGDVVLADGETVVMPGDYSLAKIQEMQFLPASGAQGGFGLFSVAVTDNGTTNGTADFQTLNETLVIRVVEALPDPIIVDVQVAASSDDAEERSGGDVKLNSSDLELTQDRSQQQVGLRFTDVNIPFGAAIQHAYIQFQTDEAGSDPTSLMIYGEAVDHASTFVDADGDISSRPTTTAAVGWSPQPWTSVGQAGADQQTPDIAAVIQELVSRPGWSSGNALSILITGTGERTAASFDGDRNGAPRLHVEYLPGNHTPTTTGIADVLVNTDAPDTVIDLHGAFNDLEDPDSLLLYSIQNNTNPSLFTATQIDATQGTLTLDYATATNGTASITVRATDTGNPALFVETTFNVSVVPVNQPPTTTGIADVSVTENADDTIINLRAAFDDPDGLASDLTFSIEVNSNPGLFTSTDLDDGQGTLTLAYAPDANGTADFTIRATDTGVPVHYVEETFTVDVAELNSPPVMTSGTIEDMSVVIDSPATSLGLSDLSFAPGTGADELGQTLSYTVTTVPAPTLGDVVLSDGSTVVIPGDYSLAQIQGMKFLAAPGAVGGPTAFTFTVSDNGTTNGVSDSKILTQSLLIDVLPPPDPIVVEVQIARSSDDAEERSSGRIKLTSSDLELIQDKSAEQVVGLRFADLNIPPGAMIQNAYIQFQADEVNSEATSLSIRGEAVDHATTFTETNGDITSRPTTSASISWSPQAWTDVGEAGAAQQTPDLAAVIQEIVNRPGWLGGNALAIIIAGSGERVAESFDGNQTGAARLHVEYLPFNPAVTTTNDSATTNPILPVLNWDASVDHANEDDREPSDLPALLGQTVAGNDNRLVAAELSTVVQLQTSPPVDDTGSVTPQRDLSQLDEVYSELGSSLAMFDG